MSAILDNFTWSSIFTSVDQLPALIGLRHRLSLPYPREEHVYEQLPDTVIDGRVVQRLIRSISFRKENIEKLEALIQSFCQAYENVHGIYVSDLDSESVNQELKQGIISLKNLSILSSPFAVLKVERDLELAETGNLEKFQENWHKKYYSSLRCHEFNDPGTCLLKAARYGDMEKFTELYPHRQGVKFSLLMRAIVEGGHVEILKYLTSGTGRASLPISDTWSELFMRSLTMPHDNTQMLSYLGIPRISNHELAHRIRYGAHINNVRFLVQHLNNGHIFAHGDVLVSIVNRGWFDLFMELLNTIGDVITQEAWQEIFTAATLRGYDIITQVATSHLDATYDYIKILLEGHPWVAVSHEKFSKILEMPEITPDTIRRFLIHIISQFETTKISPGFGPMVSVIVTSGKLSQAEIDQIIEETPEPEASHSGDSGSESD